MSKAISGLHHPAINVSDWDRSMAFYRDVLGLEPWVGGEASGEQLSKAVKMDGALLKWAMFKAGDDCFELIHYVTPEGRSNDRGWNDVGGAHVAFLVEDIDEAYERLSAKGVKFNAPPIRVEEGPLKGCAFAYFPDPDGVLLEIYQEPRG